MRYRTIRRVEQEKLATKLLRAPRVRACFVCHRVEEGRVGIEWKLSKRQQRKRKKERRGVSRPKFKGRENLARQSAAGTKKVPVRGQTLVLSLYIFDTLSVSVHDARSFVLSICDSFRHSIQSRTSLITLRATRKR